MTDSYLGLVAFIDLLGFKKLAREQSVAELCQTLDKYSGAVEDATTYKILPESVGDAEKNPTPIKVDYAIFSDCMIMYETEGMDENGVDPLAPRNLIRCCSALSYSLLRRGLPFRGCITCGEYCVKDDKDDKWPRGTILAGKPLVDAYNLERQLECIGIVVHPEVAHTYYLNGRTPQNKVNMDFIGLISPEALMLAEWEPVPTKKECPSEMKVPSALAVLPMQLQAGQNPASREFPVNAQRDLESAVGFLKDLRHKSDAKHHPKYDATLQLYKRVCLEWAAALAR